MLDGLDTLFWTLIIALAIAMPFGLWKVWEIIWWLAHHVSIT